MPNPNGNPARRRNPTQLAAEMEFCVGRRLLGFTHAQIAEDWNAANPEWTLHWSTVAKRLKKAAAKSDAKTAEKAERIVRREYDRAEAHMRALSSKVAAGDVKAIHEAGLISDRIVRLSGGDKPLKVEHTVSTAGSVDDEIRELTAMLGLNDGVVSDA